MRVDIWSDIVCPWCHIGNARFSRALADLEQRDEIEVVYRSFGLDPSIPGGQAGHQRRAVLRDRQKVRRLGGPAAGDVRAGAPERLGIVQRLAGNVARSARTIPRARPAVSRHCLC
jgi:predicted DsbA family dithiol-disulfide isomerase